MTCERIQEQLPALLDDRLATTDVAQIRTHLESCPVCQREFDALQRTLTALDTLPMPTPSPRLRTHVYAAIAAEQQAVHASRIAPPASPAPVPRRRGFRRWFAMSLAGAALLALGFTLGARSRSGSLIDATSPETAAALATQRELAALRTQLESMSQLVGYSVLQQQQSRSSNERLRGILTSAQLDNPDSKAINDLISALSADPSTNVRLNALEALYAHSDQEVVRAGVLTSLPRETSPLVQVSIIDFLVATRDRDATPALQKLSDNSQADLDVRNAAKRALSQL